MQDPQENHALDNQDTYCLLCQQNLRCMEPNIILPVKIASEIVVLNGNQIDLHEYSF